MTARSSEVLDVGCGSEKVRDAYGIDIQNLDPVDQVQDIEETPWDLPSNQFTEIHCRHVLEHINPATFPDIMKEIHRVAKPEAQIHIEVPHALSVDFHRDPTHKNPITYSTFDHFTTGSPQPGPAYGAENLFTITRREITFLGTGLSKIFFTPGKLLSQIQPHIYENILSGIIRPKNLKVTLETVKEKEGDES